MIKILTDEYGQNAVLVDTQTNTAFGPVVKASTGDNAHENALLFLAFLKQNRVYDARTIPNRVLGVYYNEFVNSLKN